MQSKDVIYIDIEDDITAIIGKVKASGNKIVALVPPKRVGVLQSAVNLKLLQRAAKTVQKNVVLITNDHSLVALAAGIKMPVAKNLQSRPEIPALEAPVTEDEEIIDGKGISVGDFATSLGAAAVAAKAEPIDEIAQDDKANDTPSAKTGSSVATAVNKIKSRIPDFGVFRKRLFLIGGGAVILVAFGVWAIFFAPKATITITAKTTPVSVNKKLTLDASKQQSDTGRFELKPTIAQVKKSVTTEFDATGSKDIGSRAKGTMTVRNCDYGDDFTLPVGTRFTNAGGKVFVSTAAVVVPQFTGSAVSCTKSGSNSGKVNVAVEAIVSGPDYNVGSQSYSMSGYSSSVDGVGTDMTGGTTEVVKVVSPDDIEKAKEQLPQASNEAAKAELQTMLDGQIIIQESFEVKTGQIVAAPGEGEQADRAKLTQETTFTLTGLSRSDIDTILKTALEDELKSKPDRQAYSYGDDEVVFQDYQRAGDNMATANLSTVGFIGPKIDVNELAKQLAGKRYGEIQATVNNIPGVQDVTIDLSPFWVSRAPSADKIDIKFTVANGS